MKTSDSVALPPHRIHAGPYTTDSRQRADRGELIVRASFARFDVVALAIALGCVAAVGLWVATVVLLLKSTPAGIKVGPHLALLANFLPGYRVSWAGSVVGLFYGFLIGAVLGG